MVRYKKMFTLNMMIIAALLFPSIGCSKPKNIGKLINPLVTPLNKKVVASNDTFQKCERPPKPIRDVLGVPFYSDKHYSIIDKEKVKLNKEAMTPLWEMKKRFAAMSQLYFSSDPKEADVAECLLDWFNEYYERNALLGEWNLQGRNEVNWAASSLARAYLRIKDEPSLDVGKKKNTEKWLKQLGQRLKAIEEGIRKPRKNNLAFWAGLSIASVGLAAEDSELYNYGMGKFQLFLDELQKDGTLPEELARKKKALSYHVFSAVPVLMLAQYAFANGENYFKKNGSLDIFVERIFKGVKSPDYFEKITKVKQEEVTPGSLGFLEIYFEHNPKKEYGDFLKEHRPFKSDTLGENLTLLYGTNL